jgi:2-polyprenyl-3-methyl-5-hydroxy-6-metoxy-1,4-benzoquinol methylase
VSSPKFLRTFADFENDPVAAYDRLAPQYEELRRRREAYLHSVEDSIIARLRRSAAALLDLGAGDGSRAARIARAAGIDRIVLLEPSSGMSKLSATRFELWPLRADELDAATIAERFDVITCLWNVLGHLPDGQKRIRVLKTAAQLLSAKGNLFVDFIHRYNVRSYGVLCTAARWLEDRVIPRESNGDVVATWNLNGKNISTCGHVFSHREIMLLAASAGLQLEERLIIDYQTGERRSFPCLGNLLYSFRRSS